MILPQKEESLRQKLGSRIAGNCRKIWSKQQIYNWPTPTNKRSQRYVRQVSLPCLSHNIEGNPFVPLYTDNMHRIEPDGLQSCMIDTSEVAQNRVVYLNPVSSTRPRFLQHKFTVGSVDLE